MRVTPAAERKIRAGHPWLFDQSITSLSHDGQPGDLAVVFDKKRDFLAIGLFDPASPIRVRIVHSGRPQQIDPDFWRGRVLDAVDARQQLVDDPQTTAYRLINGESDGFGGLVADRYEDALVIKLYSVAWIPHLDTIVDALVDLLDLNVVVSRCSRLLRTHERFGLEDGGVLVGALPDHPIEFLENGLEFLADIVKGQKTGHFLDQRDNRAMVRALASGASVLDVFSCTGGFSVHAAAGGAVDVTSVDQSSHALDAARTNMDRNRALIQFGAAGHRVVCGDAFEVMAAMARDHEGFDMVIIDPPSFANRQEQVGAALRAYQRLTRLGLELVNEGGTLVQASCSSRVTTEDFVAVVQGAAAEADILLDNLIVTGHPVDHPATFPEAHYLKAVFSTPR